MAEEWNERAKTYVEQSERMTWLWAQDGLTIAGYTGKIDKPAKLLDIACGPGRLAMAATEMGFKVTATDMSEAMLERVKERAAAASLNITTLATNAETLKGLTDNTFDVVTSTFGICHFADRCAAWRSMLRVLKPGGRVMATVWMPTAAFPGVRKYLMTHAVDYVGEGKREDTNGHDYVHGHGHGHGHVHARFPEMSEIEQELKDCGFADAAVFQVRHDICFSSGKQAAEMHISDALVSDHAQGKDSRSLKLCLMHYLDLKSKGIDPLLDANAPLPPKPEDGIVAEDMLIWNKPVVIPTYAHIGVANKPL